MTIQYQIIKMKFKDIFKQNYDVIFSENDEIKNGLLIEEDDSLLIDQIKIIKNYNEKLNNIIENNKDKKVIKFRINELILVEAKKGNSEFNKKIEYLIENGFKYNNKKYIRFGKSQSQAKAGITGFIEDSIYEEMMNRSQLDIKVEKCVIPKYEAQRCLIFSSCNLISEKLPHIVIVDEYTKTIKNQYIRYIEEEQKEFIDKNDGKSKKYNSKKVKETFKDIKISPFDGGGLHSIELSDKISKYIGLDYSAIGFQIRLPGMKGYSCAFDFKKYYNQIGVTRIKDVFGKYHNIEDIDCMWNTTMWKYYGLFKNEFENDGWNKYLEKLEKYNYKLGISKYSHHTKDSNLMARMNFQYLQCLDLWNKKYIKHFENGFKDDYDILDKNNFGKILNIAKYSTDLFEKIIKGNKLYTYKFLGIKDTEDYESENKMLEAILINDIMLKDVAIKQYVYRKLKKYINELKIGKIYVEGFYHTAVIDAIAYLEYCAEKEVIGCLNDNQFYCNTLGMGKFLSFRSPLVCPSEIRKINIINSDFLNQWFGHFANQDIIMFNTYDIALPQAGGMDLDGDAVFITNNSIMLNSKIEKPIIIDIDDKITSQIKQYNTKSIIEYELATRDNRIGEITNVATSIENQYIKDKKWKKIADDNISMLRIYQGKEIDSVKTGVRWHLSKYLRNYLKQLPLFLLYNYPDKLNKYFNVKSKNKQIENKEDKFKLNGYNSPSPMNELCDYICQWEKREIQWDKETVDTKCIILNNSFRLDNKVIIKQVKDLINEYAINSKEIMNNDKNEEYSIIKSKIDKLSNIYKKNINLILDDKEEIANYVIKVSYLTQSMNKTFVWKEYGDYILKNLKNNSPKNKHIKIVQVPNLTDKSCEYLGKYYEIIGNSDNE